MKNDSYEHDILPDGELSPEQKVLVDKLSKDDIEKIDKRLLENTNKSWRKMAMIVGLTIDSNDSHQLRIPDIYYAERLRLIVKEGKLEYQGYLENMRYCELRQP